MDPRPPRSPTEQPRSAPSAPAPGSRAGLLLGTTVVAIGVVLAWDAEASRFTQAGLDVLVTSLLGWHLRHASARDRQVVIACVLISTLGELFFTQVWGLYTYRFGNVPLYVPPGHGLLCLASLETARHPFAQRHRRVILGVATTTALAWATGGLLVSAHRDVEGALYLPIFLPLVWLSARGIEHSCTFALASLVELAGTQFSTWRWNPIQPWLNLPAGNPPSVAAGGYCIFTAAALGLVWLARERTDRVGERESQPHAHPSNG